MSLPIISVDGTTSNIGWFSTLVFVPPGSVQTVNNFGASSYVVDTGYGTGNNFFHVAVNVQSLGVSLKFWIQTSDDKLTWYDNASHESYPAVLGDNVITFFSRRRYWRLAWTDGSGDSITTQLTQSTQQYVTVSEYTEEPALNGNYYCDNMVDCYGLSLSQQAQGVQWWQPGNPNLFQVLRLGDDGGTQNAWALCTQSYGIWVYEWLYVNATNPTQVTGWPFTLTGPFTPWTGLIGTPENYPAGNYKLIYQYGGYNLGPSCFELCNNVQNGTYFRDLAGVANTWQNAVNIFNGSSTEAITPILTGNQYGTGALADLENYFAGFTYQFAHTGGPIGLFQVDNVAYDNVNGSPQATWALQSVSAAATTFEWQYRVAYTS